MIRAEVAQLVEHSPEKAGVDSSILSLGTISFPQFTCGFLPLWHYRLSIVSAHFRQRGNLPSFCESRHMGGHLSSPVEVELVHISGLPELPFAIRSRKLHE
jgi:hypothetical protein